MLVYDPPITTSFMNEAFAIGAIATDDQAAIHEHLYVPVRVVAGMPFERAASCSLDDLCVVAQVSLRLKRQKCV